MKKPTAIAGFAWYEKEQWPECPRLMEDEVDNTYEEWLRKALNLEATMKKDGYKVAG